MTDKEEKIILGIDWGEKRIGLAEADSLTKVAVPLFSVGNMKELEEVVSQEGADILIIGQPVKMSGDKESINPDFLGFIERLKNRLPNKRIELFDERLTSKQADSLPGDKRNKAGRDEVAAMLILQGYLDLYGDDF